MMRPWNYGLWVNTFSVLAIGLFVEFILYGAHDVWLLLQSGEGRKKLLILLVICAGGELLAQHARKK